MMTRPNRRRLITALAAAPAVLTAPAVHAQERIRWRLATSWPKNLPGPGVARLVVAVRRVLAP